VAGSLTFVQAPNVSNTRVRADKPRAFIVVSLKGKWGDVDPAKIRIGAEGCERKIDGAVRNLGISVTNADHARVTKFR
jgi:hypothetical protein